jgi:hypothetical protein
MLSATTGHVPDQSDTGRGNDIASPDDSLLHWPSVALRKTLGDAPPPAYERLLERIMSFGPQWQPEQTR